MAKTTLKYKVDDVHFKNDADEYLDVRVDDGYIVLNTETSNQFSITSQAELDVIYQKLTELLKSSKE